MLMDKLDQRGGLFLEWASAAFGDGEWCRSGELPKDNSSSAGRSTSSDAATSLPLSGQEGGNGWKVPATAQPSRLLTGFASAHFLLATGLLICVTRLFSWSAPLVLLLFLGAKIGVDIQGLGLLDW